MFNQNSSESYFLLLQYLFVSFALFLLYETMFIYFHKATPGHRFLYLRVVSETKEPTTLFQILFRSLFKFQAILFVLVPFIEIVLRRDRSTFYDRLSQTKIVSLKNSRPDDIHPDFKKLILRWVHTSIVLIFMLIGVGFYQTAVSSKGKPSLSKTSPSCRESLGQYLKNYLSKSKESESLNCARIVVEKSFESKNVSHSFSYLAQLVVSSNEDLKESYRHKYCKERPNKPLCRADWSSDFSSFKPDEEDVVNLLVEMNAALVKNEHSSVFRVLDLLHDHLDWNKNLELYYMTSYIFLNEGQSRSPASIKDKRLNWSEAKRRFLKTMAVTK